MNQHAAFPRHVRNLSEQAAPAEPPTTPRRRRVVFFDIFKNGFTTLSNSRKSTKLGLTGKEIDVVGVVRESDGWGVLNNLQ